MVLSDSYPIYGVYGKDDSEGLSTRNHRSRRAFIEEWISAGEKQRRGRKIGASTFDTPKDSEQMNRVVK